MKYKKILLIILSIFIIISTFLLTNEIFAFFKFSSVEKTINIPKNSSITKVSQILKENKLISSNLLFKFYSKLKGYNNIKDNLQHGKFKLKSNMSYGEIIKNLCDASKIIYDSKLTFSEGMDFFDVIEKYKDEENFNIKEIINEINNEENYEKFDFVKELKKEKLDEAYFPMEGFILPQTIIINKEDYSAKNIAREILKKTNAEILKLEKKIKGKKLNLLETFTLASIIIKETEDEKEMPRVSSVFHNRLKKNQRLESDVTALYFKKIEKDVKKNNLSVGLKKFEKYNTYKSKGLTPGPICIPTISAINAAVEPSDEDYYYFYADSKNKKILYSKNFNEHKKTYSS